jgi:hypothetical protein
VKRLIAALAALAALAFAPAALAFPVVICVPKAAGAAVITPNTKSECLPATEYTKQWAMGGAEKEVFTHLLWTPTGINGKPEIGFTSVNWRLSGPEGSGEGNLFIGEAPVNEKWEGSNGIADGYLNESIGKIESPIAFGEGNHVKKNYGTILGGYDNTVEAKFSSILGGKATTTLVEYESIL